MGQRRVRKGRVCVERGINREEGRLGLGEVWEQQKWRMPNPDTIPGLDLPSWVNVDMCQ